MMILIINPLKMREALKCREVKKQKTPRITLGVWVEDRVRTGDPQNHNLML